MALGEQCRRDEESLVLRRPVTADDELGALIPAALDVALNAVTMRGGDDRSDHGVLLGRVAQFDGTGVLGQSLHHLVVDVAVRIDARGRRTNLSRVEAEGCPDRRNRSGNVRVRADDGSALAAELHEHALHLPARDSADRAADARAAGETDHVDVRGVDRRLSDLDARAGDNVAHARRQPGLLEGFSHAVDRQRVLRRGLDDERVAHRQSRRDLSGRVGPGVVVGRDARDHPDRLADDDGAEQASLGERCRLGHRRRQRDLDRFERALGIAAEPLNRDVDLESLDRRRGRTGLGLRERRVVIGMLADDVRHPVQDLGALLRLGA